MNKKINLKTQQNKTQNEVSKYKSWTEFMHRKWCYWKTKQKSKHSSPVANIMWVLFSENLLLFYKY